MEERTPTDGRPYYCRDCGLGLDEFMACELPDCALESQKTAANRAIALLRDSRRRLKRGGGNPIRVKAKIRAIDRLISELRAVPPERP